jgi:hypothetical protein
MPVLVKARAHSRQITPSQYTARARQAGFDLISWTTERSGPIVENVLEGGDTFYYQTTLDALSNDGDILRTIDVLAQDVGIIGLFWDWPATTTFYANCLKSSSRSWDATITDRRVDRQPWTLQGLSMGGPSMMTVSLTDAWGCFKHCCYSIHL